MATRHLAETPEKAKMSRISRALKPDSAQLLQSSHPVTQLQSTLGNQQIARLIQAKRLSPSGEIAGIQRKLTVGAANDQYEQEADQVARQVMNTPDAAIADSMQRDISPEEEKDEMLQTKPLAASITPFVQREMAMVGDEDKKEPIQAKSAVSMSDSFEAEGNIENQLSQSKGQGSPLPNPVRSFMEPRFGVDFSQVRVHTGSDAMQMNRDVGAQAFTHGSDIYFGEGRSPTNLELTAHELTHVVQQSGGVSLQRKCAACAADDKEEQMSLPAAQLQRKQEHEIQRWWGEEESEEDEGSWLDEAVDTVSDLGNSAYETVSDTASEAYNSATETASNTYETVSDTVSSANDWASETASETGEAISETATEAWNTVSEGASKVSDTASDLMDVAPNLLGDIDVNALASQAANQIVTETQNSKLPRVQQAEDLISRANAMLEGNTTPGVPDIDLPPPPSGQNINECCPKGTLQSTRAAMDPARTGLQAALQSFKNAQKDTALAAEQGKKICLGAGAAGVLAFVVGLAAKNPVASVGVIFAACITCIGSALPVQNAIKKEGDAYDALIPAMETLKKAMSNYESCAVSYRNCPDYPIPIDPTRPGGVSFR